MIYFIILYLIVCAAYFGWCFRINREEAIYRLSIILTMPVFGMLLLTLIDFLVHKFQRIENIAALVGVDRHFEKESFEKADFKKETDIIPFEEALILNPGETKRRLIIDALKKDIESYVTMLEKALRDPDSETSHYAASAIMEIRRKLTIAIQEYTVKYEEDKTNPEVVAEFASVLKRYLRAGFLDERTKEKYQHIYFKVLQNLLTFPSATIEHYIDKINCDLELKDFWSAKEDCERLWKHYPDREECYILRMKLYYTIHDKTMLNQVIKEFKSSSIPFSHDALNKVRYWTEDS